MSGNLDELNEVASARVKGFDGEDKVVGLAQVRAYFEGLRAGLTRAHFVAQVVACEGERVAVCGKTTGIHSGTPMGLPASGRKIAEVRSFWDVPALLEQAGLPVESVLALK